ncbi:MAG: aminotransferase class III-fold pyridoxal phosphate-dependent enzyme, partial [Halobacteriota archaeon]
VLLDPHEQGEAARFARWEFDEQTAGRMLSSNRFERGIHVRVPLPPLPSHAQRLHLFVRYTDEGGRASEADGLVENASQQGAAVVERLEEVLGDAVTIRGRGLLVGIEFDRPVGPLLRALALDEHVLALEAGRRTIRLLPPLTIEEAHVNRIVDALESVVATAEVGP